MSSFTYTNNIPFSGNNPSNDQPNMEANTNSISQILAVDHVSFNAAYGGTHTQTQFDGFSTAPIPAGAESSVAYPAAGTADTGHAQYYFKNALNTYALSLIKAFGIFSVSNTPDLSAEVNCASISGTATSGTFVVTFESNTIANVANTAGVLVSSSTGGSPRYSIDTGAGTVTFQGLTSVGVVITFVVLQI